MTIQPHQTAHGEAAAASPQQPAGASRLRDDTQAALPTKPKVTRFRELPEKREAQAEDPARGQTYLDEEVVSIIARAAAEQVPGIHRIGESNLVSLLPAFGRDRGVISEVGQSEAAVDIEIVVEFGYPIAEVSRELRHHVIETVETMTGRRVVEVNVYVVDLHMPRTSRTGRRSHRQLA